MVGAAVALVLVIGAVVAFSSGSQSSGSTIGDCNRAVDRLTANINADKANPKVSPTIARASFAACPNPQAWRDRGWHDQISGTLGRYFNDPEMDPDFALHLMCAQFDAYDTTRTCQLLPK